MVVFDVLLVELERVLGHLPRELVVLRVDAGRVERVGLAVDVHTGELEVVDVVGDFEERDDVLAHGRAEQVGRQELVSVDESLVLQ